MSDLKNLSHDERMMILVMTLNTLASTLASAFINVYLYTYTASMASMALFTAIRISLFPFFFTIGGHMTAKRRSFDTCLALGFLLFMVQLASVLLLRDAFATYPLLVYLIAVITGVGEGFKWLALNSLTQIVSPPLHRGSYVALQGIFGNVANVAAPAVSTLLITMAPSDTIGYLRIFGTTLAVYVVLIGLAFVWHVPCSPQPFAVVSHLHVTTRDHQWRYVLVTTFLYGMRDSLDLMLTGLLLYNAVGQSGGAYSRLLVAFAVAAVVAHRLSSRLMRRGNRMFFYLGSGVLMTSATVVLVLCPNIFGVIYYGLTNAIAGAFFSNAYAIIIANALNDYTPSENIIGRVIAKETSQSVGRVLGMLLVYAMFMLWPSSYLVPAVIILSSASTVLGLYAFSYHRARDRVRLRAAR